MLWHFNPYIANRRKKVKVEWLNDFERVQINLQASMSPGQHRNVHTFNTAGDFDQLLDIDFQPALPRIKPAFQCTQLDILLYSSKQLMHYEHITPKTHIRHFSVVTGRQSRRHRTRENHKSSQGLFLAMLWPRLGLTILCASHIISSCFLRHDWSSPTRVFIAAMLWILQIFGLYHNYRRHQKTSV